MDFEASVYINRTSKIYTGSADSGNFLTSVLSETDILTDAHPIVANLVYTSLVAIRKSSKCTDDKHYRRTLCKERLLHQLMFRYWLSCGSDCKRVDGIDKSSAVQNAAKLIAKKIRWFLAMPLAMAIAVPVQAQSVVPSADGTNTSVNQNGNRLDISGGTTAGSNLFHSFTQFNLNSSQTANFLSNPSIQNILGRIINGKPSVIDGLIQVTGGNSNLFLINPSGIVFGPNARLNVPSDFTATAANGIDFGNGRFNAVGDNNYAALVGTPTALAFLTPQPGAIVNAGELAVGKGQNLNLSGGTVVSTGHLSAPGGNVTVVAVAGGSLLRISQPGHLLSLEIQPLATDPSLPNAPSLPQLLTGSGDFGNATGLIVNSNGQAQLTGSGIAVANGDVVTQQLTSQTATLSANHNLTLAPGTSLNTTADLNLLAQNTVQVRDSVTAPFIAHAGGQLYLQGDQGVDIFALNNPASGFFSGGDLVLRSANTVGGDAHFSAGGSFRVEQLDGTLGNLFSPYDPVILANGDVQLANYTGASLHILAGGSVTIPGQIQITGVDTAANTINPSSPDPFLQKLANVTLSNGNALVINGSTQPTLDIRAGIDWTLLGGLPASTVNPALTPPATYNSATSADITLGQIITSQGVPATVFLTNQYMPNTALTGGQITVNTNGNNAITLNSPLSSLIIDSRSGIALRNSANNGPVSVAGNITLIANNDITAATISSSLAGAAPGDISLTSSNGNIDTFLISADCTSVCSRAGNISVNAQGNISVAAISATTPSGGNGGNISVNSSNGTITVPTPSASQPYMPGSGASYIRSYAAGASGNGGAIALSAAGAINVLDALDSHSQAGLGGNVNLTSGGAMTIYGINSSAAGASSNGSTTTPSAAGASGNGGAIALSAAGAINVLSTIDSHSQAGLGGNVNLTSGGATTLQSINSLGSTTASAGSGGNVAIANTGSLNVTGNLNLGGALSQTGVGAVSLAGNIITNNSNISFSSAVALTGGVIFNPGSGNLTFGSSLATGSNSLTLAASGIDFNGPVSGTSTLVLQPTNSSQNIAIAPTASVAGALNLTAKDLTALQKGFSSITIGRSDGSGTITIGNDVIFKDPVTIQSPVGAGAIAATGKITGNASVNLLANSNISTSDITASGGISLKSNTGAVGTGNLTSSGSAVNIIASDRITTGVINSSSATGNGGSVTLDPKNNVVVTSINAQGGPKGSGGKVNVATDRFFQALGTFIDQNGVNASISTAGGVGGGSVTIQEGSGATGVPFVVGDPTTSGTAGAITSGAKNSTISPSQSFTGTTTQGNLKIVTPKPLNPIDLTNPSQPTNNAVSPLNNSTSSTTNTQSSTTSNSNVLQSGTTTQLASNQSSSGTDIQSSSNQSNNGTGTQSSSNQSNNGTGTQSSSNQSNNGTGTQSSSNQSNNGTGTQSSSNQSNNGTGTQSSSNQSNNGTGTQSSSNQSNNGTGTQSSSNQSNNGTGTQSSSNQSNNGTGTQSSSNQSSSGTDTQEVGKNTATQSTSSNSPNLSTSDAALVGINESLTSQFQQYLGVGNAPSSTTNPRATLQQVEAETGIKPALVYAAFVPAVVSLEKAVPNKSVDSREPESPVNLQEGIPQLNRQDSDQLELILVTAHGQTIRRRVKGATRARVLEVAKRFEDQVSNPNEVDSDDYLESAHQLYRWLVTPIETDLQAQGSQNLAFIMDAGLRSIPMAALYDGQKFLVEKYSMGLMPSLSLTDTHYSDLRHSQVLAMGADHFTQQNSLPAVPAELEMITKGLWQGKSFLNNAFTLENLKFQRKQTPFGIVHLATHAVFKPGVPSNSYIQLWDTRLQLNQLRQLGWNHPPVELLVLSACETALGDEDAELGFAGLAVSAGVKSALGSLWHVSDEGSLGLMADFYQQLKTAPIRSEALRQAQIAMLRGQVRIEGGKLRTPNGDMSLPPTLAALGDEDLTHPYYWAAFTMIGDPW